MTQHPHAEFLAEALLDTSRVIEGSYNDQPFQLIPLQQVICATGAWTFRFADTAPKAPVVRSGLTDDAIRSIFRNHEYPNNPAEMADNLRGCRAIANAAAQEIVTRIMGLDAVTRLDDVVFTGGRSRIQVIDFMHRAIAHFLENLPSALEKNHE